MVVWQLLTFRRLFGNYIERGSTVSRNVVFHSALSSSLPSVSIHLQVRRREARYLQDHFILNSDDAYSVHTVLF